MIVYNWSVMVRKFLRSFSEPQFKSNKQQAYKEKIEWLKGNHYKTRF